MSGSPTAHSLAPRPITLWIVVSYLIVGLMMVCLAYAGSAIVGRIFLDWNGAYIPFLAFVIAIEALISHRQLNNSPPQGPHWLAWRAAEWVVLAIFIKLALYLFTGPSQLIADVGAWQGAFLARFSPKDISLPCCLPRRSGSPAQLSPMCFTNWKKIRRSGTWKKKALR